MGLGRRIDAAISAAIGGVMSTYGQERTGTAFPPLSWSLGTDGALHGCAGADCTGDEVAGVLIRWVEALDLTQTPVSSSLAGSMAYEGVVEGRSLHVWGVTDRDIWEQS